MSGVGRGRGWLNIKNGAKPGGNVASLENTTSEEIVEINKYKDLIGLISLISITDDGIQMNRKLSGIFQKITADFQNDDEIKECMQYIFQLGLKEETLATNFALMMSLKPFLNTPIYKKKLRDFLIDDLQGYFTNVKMQQLSNPRGFRNFARMICRYFSKAKLLDGTPMKIFAGPVLNSLDILLEAGKVEDLEAFTTMLNITYVYLNDICRPELEILVNKVRFALIKNEFTTHRSRLWLLLALDLAHFPYCAIPLDIYNAYVEQLGEKVLVEFQVVSNINELNMQTIQTTNTDSYQPDINTLPPSIETNLVIEEVDRKVMRQNNYASHFIQTPNEQTVHSIEKLKQSQSGKLDMNAGMDNWECQAMPPTTTTQQQPPNRDKPGRPILGAGARMNKDWKNEDPSKKFSSSWDNKQSKQGYQEKNKFGSKPNKAWQHDDRFDTDYN